MSLRAVNSVDSIQVMTFIPKPGRAMGVSGTWKVKRTLKCRVVPFVSAMNTNPAVTVQNPTISYTITFPNNPSLESGDKLQWTTTDPASGETSSVLMIVQGRVLNIQALGRVWSLTATAFTTDNLATPGAAF